VKESNGGGYSCYTGRDSSRIADLGRVFEFDDMRKYNENARETLDS
jgi:hypothetical protein